MIEYRSKYSDTMEDGRRGQWARLAYVNELCIAWIDRYENSEGDSDHIYHVKGNFPSCKNNDNPTLSVVAESYDEAKLKLEAEWGKFLRIIYLNKEEL